MASPGMAATAMELAATAAVISMTVIFFSSRASMEALWYSGADTLSDTTKSRKRRHCKQHQGQDRLLHHIFI